MFYWIFYKYQHVQKETESKEQWNCDVVISTVFASMMSMHISSVVKPEKQLWLSSKARKKAEDFEIHCGYYQIENCFD